MDTAEKIIGMLISSDKEMFELGVTVYFQQPEDIKYLVRKNMFLGKENNYKYTPSNTSLQKIYIKDNESIFTWNGHFYIFPCVVDFNLLSSYEKVYL